METPVNGGVRSQGGGHGTTLIRHTAPSHWWGIVSKQFAYERNCSRHLLISLVQCVEMGRYCSTVWWGGDTISTEKCLLTWYYVQSATTCSLNISNSITLSLHKFNHQSIYIFFSWHRHSPITSKTCSRSVTCAALQQSGGCSAAGGSGHERVCRHPILTSPHERWKDYSRYYDTISAIQMCG